MRNIFGKMYHGDDYEFLCKNLSEWSKIDSNKGQLVIVSKAKKCRANIEKISNLVLEIIHNQPFYKRLIFIMHNDAGIKESLDFDVKFLMIASYYYMQLTEIVNLNNETEYVHAFKKNIKIRSNRSKVKANNQQLFPLSQFFKSGKQTKLFESVLDIGIVLGIIGSSSRSVNPYIFNGKTDALNDRFYYMKFLQLFKYAFIEIADIRTLFKNLEDACDHVYDCDCDTDIDAVDKIMNFIANTSKYGYAILNQFLIERLTNINYITSLYSKKNRFPDYDRNSEIKLVLEDWIKFPLLKTRMTLLSRIDKGFLLWDKNCQDNISFWLNKSISIALTAFHYLMKECKYTIKKNQKYFENIYCNPNDSAHCADFNSKDKYLFFVKQSLKNKADTAKEENCSLLPVERLSFNNHREELQFETFAKRMSKVFDDKTRELEEDIEELKLQTFDSMIDQLRIRIIQYPEIINEVGKLCDKYQKDFDKSPLMMYEDLSKGLSSI